MMLAERLQPIRMPVAEQLKHIRNIQETGSEESWTLMLRQFQRAIYRYSTARCNPGEYNRAEARESMVLQRFMRAIMAFDTNRGIAPSTYILCALGNSINESEFSGPIRIPSAAWSRKPEDYRRAIGSVQIVSDMCVNPDPTPEDEEIRLETQERVRQEVKRLPARLAKLVQMRMEGKTLSEVGRVFHVSKERVRQLEQDAFETLRGRLSA